MHIAGLLVSLGFLPMDENLHDNACFETRETTHRETRKRVERNPIIITTHGGVRGYSRIRAGDGAQSLTGNKAQGDG